MNKIVNICGVSLDECKNDICTKCGSYCEVRTQDKIEERLYNYCRSHNCLRHYSRGIDIYNENDLKDYLEKHPKEIERRKWLKEFVISKGWIIN